MNETLEQLKVLIEELKTRIVNYGSEMNEIEARRRELAEVVGRLEKITQEPETEPKAKKSHDTRPMADMRRAARAAAKRLDARALGRVKFKPHKERKETK